MDGSRSKLRAALGLASLPALSVAMMHPLGCKPSKRPVDEPSGIDAAIRLDADAAVSPLDVGPADSHDRGARERAVLRLLSGELAPDRLPVVATEEGASLDLTLRDRLVHRAWGPRDDLDVLGSRAHPTGGTATIGPVTSSRPIANVKRVVSGMRAGFRSCYNRVLQGSPKAAGVVSMTVLVDAEGIVTDTHATRPSQTMAPAVACMRARATAAQFDAPKGGGAAQIRFMVTLAVSPRMR